MTWKDGGLIWTHGDDSRTVAYIVYRGWADDYFWIAYGGREGQEKSLEEAKAAAEEALKDERLLCA